jgi:hypothetical protein
MSAITAASSSDSQAVAALLSSNSSTGAAASAALAKSGAASGAGSASVADGGGKPATIIDLSDHAKSILARAETDQVVADRLQAFVQSRRAGATASAPSTSAKSNPPAGGGSKVDQAFAQLTAVSVNLTDQPPSFAPVEPAKDFSSSLSFEGYTLSVSADAGTGAFSAALDGSKGTIWTDQRFGQNGEVAGGTAIPVPGGGVGDAQIGNFEYVTVFQAAAEATNVTASSDAGTISESAASAQSTSLTFAIDFTTGAIHAVKSEQSVAATSAQFAPGRPLSILA